MNDFSKNVAKMTNDKRFSLVTISLLAILVMLFLAMTLLMAFGGAAFAEPSLGSEANPIMISTPEQLAALGVDYLGVANSGLYFELANDIDLSGYLAPAEEDAGTPAGAGYNDGAGWVPIGSSSSGFHGHLDGAGFKVTGLWMNRGSEKHVGLFGYSYGTIKNLGVGIAEKTFEELGIVLTAAQETAGVELTDVVGVRGNSSVGGLVGLNSNGTITNCYATGNVFGGNYVGGLVGESTGTVTASCATGNVTGNSSVGGLVGYSYNSGGTITDCYATGNVTAAGNNVGGLTGVNFESVITNCYATGKVKATGATTESVGGVVGLAASSTIKGCFFDIDTTDQTQGVGNNAEATGVYGKTTAEMKKKATFTTWLTRQGETAWNFANTWGIVENVTYPVLQWQLFSGGTGSETDPYIIKTAEQLSNLNYFLGNTHSSKYFELGNDIDLSAYLAPADEDAGTPAGAGYNDGAGWVQVSKFYGLDTAFYGHLNGAGFKVTGLWMNRGSEDNVGLFGYLRGTIKNLGVEMSGKTFSDLDIALTTEQATAGVELTDVVGVYGNDNVGGLVGSGDGTITSSYATGAVTGKDMLGGLVGYNSGTITSSYATGAVTGSGAMIGGLVGNNRGTITSSYATGAVIGECAVGGLVGHNNNGGAIENSYATGKVTATVASPADAGGLVGYNGISGTITSSYATGNVSGYGRVGGLVGLNAKGTITSSYATGKVTATVASPASAGGLVGENSGTITASFFDTDTTDQTQGVGNNAEATGVYGKTTAEMKKKATFTTWLTGQGETAWNFANTWAIVEGIKYPILQWQLDGSMFSGGTGSEADPYIIKTAEQLSNLNYFLGNTHSSKYFELGNDIDLSAYLAPADEDAGTLAGAGYNDGAGWVPIGKYGTDTTFFGHLDGAGFKVTGLWMNRGSEDDVGLFGSSRGTIKNLGVEIAEKTFEELGIVLTAAQETAGVELTDVVGVRGSKRVGGLVGWNEGTITSSYATGNVTGEDGVGGLVGDQREGTITSSYATGAVTGSGAMIGGLVGNNNNSKIYSSYATGAVTGKNRIGGLVGFNNDGTITSSYATGAVTGTSYVGGLVGVINSGTITSSYATGAVTGASYVGGLVGRNEGGTITASFFDTDTTGQTNGVGNNAEATGVYGLSTFRLKNASTYAAWLEELEETAWDTDVWLVQNGYYPQLKAFMCDGCAGATHACDCEEDECACICAICAGIDAMLCPHCGVGLDESGVYTHKTCVVCDAECDGDSYVHTACPVCGDDYDTENSVHIHEKCLLCDEECDGEVYVHKTCVVCDADCDGGSYVHTACPVCGDEYDSENGAHAHETCDICGAECDGDSYVHTVCLVCGAGYDTENNAHVHTYGSACNPCACGEKEACDCACGGTDCECVCEICNPTATPPCATHIDANSDGLCDTCGKTISTTKPIDPDGEDNKKDDEGKDGLSGGAIAGIAIGAVAGAVLIAFAAYMLLKKRKSLPKGGNPSNAGSLDDSSGSSGASSSEDEGVSYSASEETGMEKAVSEENDLTGASDEGSAPQESDAEGTVEE